MVTNKLFRKKGFAVEVETFKIDGKKEEFVKFVQPNSVVILPISAGKVLLERHYRRAIRKYVYEFPAGHINKNEKPSAAALRELMEETGYCPYTITAMFRAREAQPRLNNFIYFYLAKSLKKCKKPKDKAEIITNKWIDEKEFIALIKKGKITDLKTLAAYTYYKAL